MRGFFGTAVWGALGLFLSACGASPGGGEGPAPEPLTLRVVSPSGPGVQGIYEIAGRFSESRPHVSVEVALISGSVPINAFLSSKFAVGDAPDLLIYQAGSAAALFAQGGHLLDLGGAGFEGRFSPGAEETCRYGGRLYALPLDIAISGLFVQMSVLWRAYAKNSDPRILPRTLGEFVDSCEKLRAGGIEYPLVIGAAGDAGAAPFLYQYLHQNIYARNPGVYRELSRGERPWTGGEFREMFRAYEGLRPYINPDAARIDGTEAIRRFAGGEAAYYIGGSGDIAPIRRHKQDLDMLLLTPPWTGNPSGALPLSGVDRVISVSAATRFPGEAKAFLGEFTSVYGAELYARAAGSISAVSGSHWWYDSSLGPLNEVYRSAPLTEFIFREWPPDFEARFRRLSREWIAGKSGDAALEELDRNRPPPAPAPEGLSPGPLSGGTTRRPHERASGPSGPSRYAPPQ